MKPTTSRLTALLGTASLLTMGKALDAQAQQQMAQAQIAQAQVAQAGQEVPEQVLITGSLIRGTAAVGVPVTNLSPRDFNVTGALTTTDLFRTIPAATVQAEPVATAKASNLQKTGPGAGRGLGNGTAPPRLLVVG